MSNPPWTNHLPIRELKAGMKNTNTEFMVLEQIGMNHTKDGANVWVFKVADISGAINLAVIGDNGKCLRPGDICRVYNGFATVFKGALTFYVGKGGQLRKTGEFCFPICEEPNMSMVKMIDPSAAHSKEARGPSQGSRNPSSSHHTAPKPTATRPAGLHLLAMPQTEQASSSQASPEIFGSSSRHEHSAAHQHPEPGGSRSKNHSST
ncbi:SOSS complex subunit B1-like [Paramacrobiotus metropolitanus]|uniref:SOSS complex subunit B1-like n=1 Tax=Paramacrobiotus metropolitanus TaxID=2943436 RepID=UPI0024458C32|nr:SOSS complex subunit B1-like [Paramacrobiotus metropolitanus]XP_055336734.1 SOSS complex subunit B1-like [Paramacrobiotus metropolitanus]XP_055336741.1 SOSS complex subunit B1-like [Paramacrobiotus metropolitanus]XP_055336749.1 SOSS complex subunit B1-like [Paramacrobiotus metropolitanus]